MPLRQADRVTGVARVLMWLVLAPLAAAVVVLVGLSGAGPDATLPQRQTLLVAALLLYTAALLLRATRAEPGEREAWVVAAALAPLAGVVIVTGEHGAHGWAAAARGAVCLMLLLALVLSPGVRRGADGAVMVVLDGWALVVGPFVVLLAATAWFDLLPRGDRFLGSTSPLVGIWVVLDLLVLALFVGLLRRAGPGRRSALIPLVASMAAATIADTLTWRVGLVGAVDVWSDATWMLAIVCAAAAAVGSRPLFVRENRGLGAVREESGTWLPAVVAGVVVVLVAAGSFAMAPPAGTASPPEPEIVALVLSLVAAVIAQTVLLLRTQARLTRQLRETSTRFRTIVDGSSDVVLVCDADGLVRFASPASRTVLGRDPVRLEGAPLDGLVHEADRARLVQALGQPGPTDASTVAGVTASLVGDVAEPVRVSRDGGGWRHMEVRIQPHDTDAVPGGLTLVLRDVSERVRMQRELERRARLDALTGLPNRWWFGRTLSHRLVDGLPTSVVFVDLDEFKAVNDTEGHAVGDRLLVAAARRLRFAVGDADVVGRLSGDEFAVVVCDDDEARVHAVAERLLAEISVPYTVGTRRVRLAASIGLAVAGPGSDADSVLRDADLAMYEAKRSGGQRVVRSHPRMLQAVIDRTELDRRVRAAVAADDFELVYQPLVDLRDGRVVAAEALLRWPSSGVSPTEFVPRLEQTGLIEGVGAVVLHRALEQAAAWRRAGRPIGICVNLSPLQLGDEGLVQRVRTALADTGLPPDMLTLEVTESLLLRDLDAAVDLITHLRATGVHVALDDFGTGYSSLAYLHRLPIDVLKVDRSFVRAAASSERDRVVLRAIVALGRGLGLSVVAEGVQEVAQVDLLLSLGCTVAQGFLLAGPTSAEDMPGSVPLPQPQEPGALLRSGTGMRDTVSTAETDVRLS